MYSVESPEEALLRLVRSDGGVLQIKAMNIVHQEAVPSPVALVVAEQEDELHVVLLLPDGKGWDAVGSSSGVRSRGATMVPLTSTSLRVALAQAQATHPPASTAPAISKLPLSQALAPSIVGTPGFPSTPPVPRPNIIFFTVQGSNQGKFKGEVTRKGFEDRMQALSFNYEVISPRDAASGSPAGKRQHLPIRLTKPRGIATTQLFSALVNNELLPTVMIDFIASVEGQMTLVQTIKLTNAFLVEIKHYTDTSDAGRRSLEDAVFIFQTIETINHAGKTTVSDSW